MCLQWLQLIDDEQKTSAPLKVPVCNVQTICVSLVMKRKPHLSDGTVNVALQSRFSYGEESQVKLPYHFCVVLSAVHRLTKWM